MILLYRLGYHIGFWLGLFLSVWGAWKAVRLLRVYDWTEKRVLAWALLTILGLAFCSTMGFLLTTAVAYAPKTTPQSQPRQIREGDIPPARVEIPPAKNKIGAKEDWGKVLERTEEVNKEHRDEFKKENVKGR